MHVKSWVVGFLATGLAFGLAGEMGRAADQPVVIGLEIPLSPPGDPVGGQMIRRGAELAVEYVNKEMKGVDGGKQIALSVEDTQGRTEAGVSGYRKLVGEDHAVAVTGFFHSSVNIAVNEVAHQMGVPTVGTQTSAADVTLKHYPEAFRTHAIDPIRAATWLELIKNKGWTKVSLLAETTDYGIGLVEETKKQAVAGKMGLDIQAITFDHATTDLTPQLLQIKAFKPDVIINIGVGQPMDLMLDQATTIGLTPATPMVISYDAPVRPQFWQLHAKDGVGVYFIAYYSPQQKLSDLGDWLAKAYQAKYNEAPTYGNLNGFGDVAIIAQAVDQAKSEDPKAIIEALGTGTFKSWADSPVTFPDADGVYYHNWSPPMLILQYTKPNEDWKEATIALERKSGK